MKTATDNAQKSASKVSKILEEKRVEDILSPKPIYATIAGTEYKVRPMRKKELMHVGESLRAVVGVFQQFLDLDLLKDMAAEDLAQQIAPLIPSVIEILLPHADALIAGCLRLDDAGAEEFIEDNLTLAGRITMLHLILEVEDIPLLITAFQELTMRLKGVFPASSVDSGNTDQSEAQPKTD